MNLKLNNDGRNSVNLPAKPITSSVKEERRRTGRYIAILVGILLFLLAIYHAWVRRIPVVASLVVPALIMFIYVGWVLYTASRDKHRAAMRAIASQMGEQGVHISEAVPNKFEVNIVANKHVVTKMAEDGSRDWKLSEMTSIVSKGDDNDVRNKIKPLILVNDELPIDDEQARINMTSVVVEAVPEHLKVKILQSKRRFKRKYCRRKHEVFKRSYSIA